MYRFLLQPRWLAFHLLVVVSVVACTALGWWQWTRFQAHLADEEQTAVSARTAQPPVSIGDLVTIGRSVSPHHRGRLVTATGTYDAARQLLVPDRMQRDRVGFFVLTPLVTSDGTAVVVNRGWVESPAGASGVTGAEPPAQVPAPPPGEARITGRLEMSETPENSGVPRRTGLPDGQVALISTADLVNRLPYRLYDGYVALTGQEPPASGLEPADAPPRRTPTITARAWQNLGYTAQWFLFAAVAVFMWFRVVGREAQERRMRAWDPVGPGTGDAQERAPGRV